MPHMRGEIVDLRSWAKRAPAVPESWFLRPEGAHGIHGTAHIQRVHILAERLARDLAWDDTARRRVLAAALWHDLGRTHDGDEPEHGARSAERAVELHLVDTLPPADAQAVLFAIRYHSLADETGRAAGTEGDRQILWLLKDADALDRIRLGRHDLDTSRLRFAESRDLVGFATRLFLLGRA